MSDQSNRTALEAQLDRLREVFDSSFTRPIRDLDTRAGQMICFTAGGALFAAAMSGLQVVVRCAGLTPIPARAAALLGLAVVRAQVVPVYSLAGLTGMGVQTSDTRWLLLLQGTVPVALAIDSVDGYALESRVESAGNDAAPMLGGVVRHHGNTYAALHVAEIYSSLVRMAPQNERES